MQRTFNNSNQLLQHYTSPIHLSDREVGSTAEQQGRAAVRRAPPGTPAGPTRGAPQPREAEASCGPAEAAEAAASCAAPGMLAAAGAAPGASACA